MKPILVFAILIAVLLCFSPAFSQNSVGFNFGIGMDMPTGTFSSDQPGGRMCTFRGQMTYSLQDNVTWLTEVSYHFMNFNTTDKYGIIDILVGPRISQSLNTGALGYLTVPTIGILSAGGYLSASIGLGIGLIIPYANSSQGIDIGIRFTHAGPFFPGPLRDINILNLQFGITVF